MKKQNAARPAFLSATARRELASEFWEREDRGFYFTVMSRNCTRPIV